MRSVARKIKDLRLSLGLRQPDFAKLVGDIDQSTISRWEQGKQKPRPEQVVRLSEIMGVTPQQFLNIPSASNHGEAESRVVRITGNLQAGQWAEATDLPIDEQTEIPAPLSPEWDDVDIHARVVVGSSMNLYYPDGSVVYIAPLTSLGRTPKSGERVVVQRVGADGMYEATLKEYIVDESGKVWLWPRSTDPEHQAPIRYAERGKSVSILGVVVASFVVEASI